MRFFIWFLDLEEARLTRAEQDLGPRPRPKGGFMDIVCGEMVSGIFCATMNIGVWGPKTGFLNFSLKEFDFLDVDIRILGSKVLKKSNNYQINQKTGHF